MTVVIVAYTYKTAERVARNLSLQPAQWVFPAQEAKLYGASSFDGTLFIEGWQYSKITASTLEMISSINHRNQQYPFYIMEEETVGGYIDDKAMWFPWLEERNKRKAKYLKE